METGFSNLLFHIIYVKNTLLLLIKEGREGTEKIIDFLDHLHPENQKVALQRDSRYFQNLSGLLDETLCRLSRFDKLIFIDGENLISFCNYSGCLSGARLLVSEYYEGQVGYETFHEKIMELLSTINDKNFIELLVTNIIFQKNQLNKDASGTAAAEFLKLIAASQNTESILSFFDENFNHLLPPKSHATAYKPFIEKLLTYTMEHLSDPAISLKWLANNYLFMNVDYVSKQFYKQTGEKFSSWLNRQRIERAKELLLQCDTEKIYAVAEAVGCGSNPQYFSYLFKKYTGLSPTDYINRKGGE